MSQQLDTRLTLWVWQRGKAKQLLTVFPLPMSLQDASQGWCHCSSSSTKGWLRFKSYMRQQEQIPPRSKSKHRPLDTGQTAGEKAIFTKYLVQLRFNQDDASKFHLKSLWAQAGAYKPLGKRLLELIFSCGVANQIGRTQLNGLSHS